MTEEIKQAKQVYMKINLDSHMNEKKNILEKQDFLGMSDKEILMNKHVLTKMGIL